LQPNLVAVSSSPSASADNDQHPMWEASRSPSATSESVRAAEYQEWPFQGFLKRVRIGSETTYHLEFKLPCISERFDLPISDEGLSVVSNQEAPATPVRRRKRSPHSRIHSTAPSTHMKRAPWTPQEDHRLRMMRDKGCSWEEIHAALPHRSKGTIQVRYSTKLRRR
jgi:hypothetical protein